MTGLARQALLIWQNIRVSRHSKVECPPARRIYHMYK